VQVTLSEDSVNRDQIGLISGHLTASMADPIEIDSWAQALSTDRSNFPMINSLKSMIGHCIGAAGSIESVAAVLQLHHQYIHPSINCEDLHPQVLKQLSEENIPYTMMEHDLEYVIKAIFGFGDVNTSILFKRIG
jgi:3-oxoacyl-(acyl-carrier-protein) synthase